jgi:RHS repeat-associated protein
MYLALVIMLIIGLYLWKVSTPHAQEIIDPRSGKLSFADTDLVLQSGPIHLLIQRTLQKGEGDSGLLGKRWLLNWEKRLIQTGPILVVREMPAPTAFTQEAGSEVYKSASREEVIFQKDGQAIRTKPDGTKEKYDSKGRLVEVEYLNNNKIKLTYNSKGRIERIEGPTGVYLKLTSDDQGRVTLIEASTGTRIRYIYNKDSLTELQINNGPPVRYAYSEKGALIKIDRPVTGAVELKYDAKGRVTKRLWADRSEECYEYDDVNNALRHIDPIGEITIIRWSQDGRQEEITDPLGNKTVIDYNEDGRPLSVTNPAGITSRFTYDDLGRTIVIEGCCGMVIQYEYLEETALVKTITYSDGSNQKFEYDKNRNLIAIREGNESAINYAYNKDGSMASIKGTGMPERRFSYHPDGRLKSETNALGQTTTYEYDKQGNLIRITNAIGGVTLYKYDNQSRLISKTDPERTTNRYVYDAKGRLIQTINPIGSITRYEYDVRGRIVAETDPAGRTTRYQYDSNGRLLNIIYPNDSTYQYVYDAVGNLVRETNRLGGIITRTYDPLGRVMSLTDASGRKTTYEYSSFGSLTKIIGPLGEGSEYSYDSQGRRNMVMDPVFVKTYYERDSKGRITKTISPDGSIRTYVYDKAGNLTGESGNRGMGIQYEYDALGRVIVERMTTGLVISYKYDALGDILRIEDNHGGSLTMQYDSNGRLTSATEPSGATTKYRYDLSGRLLESTNPMGHAKSMTYNVAAELTQVREATGDTARYEYDKAGRLTSIYYPSGGVTKYDYDAMGNLLIVTNPIGAKANYVYDKAGQLIGMTDAKSQNTIFVYNRAGRLSRKQLSDGKIINYKYDAAGKVLEVDDGSFPVQYSYNTGGQLTQINYPAIKKSLKYEYDSVGLLSRFLNSDGQMVLYEYDSHKRLNAMKLPGGKIMKFTYDAKNRLTSIVYPNGIKGSWEYDTVGRLTRVSYANATGKSLYAWRYMYDAAGNLINIADTKGQTTKYQYDPIGQLIQEVGPIGTLRYSHLPGGNRKQFESKGKIIQYQYNLSDQLENAGEETFKYDANGNLVERMGPRGVTRYTYDVENRLIKAVLPGGDEVAFGYAPNGERIWRRDKNGLTWFVTDGLNLFAELDENLNSKATYLHSSEIDYPLTMSRDGQNYFYHQRALGSVAALTDSNGNISASYETDAFGNLTSTDGTLLNPFIFTGREFDRDLNLYYYRARYYDPALGRFLSKDPDWGSTRDPISLNRYAYVQNAPTRYRDPLGKEAIGDEYMHPDPGAAPRVRKTPQWLKDLKAGNLTPELDEQLKRMDPSARKMFEQNQIKAGIVPGSGGPAPAGPSPGEPTPGPRPAGPSPGPEPQAGPGRPGPPPRPAGPSPAGPGPEPEYPEYRGAFPRPSPSSPGGSFWDPDPSRISRISGGIGGANIIMNYVACIEEGGSGWDCLKKETERLAQLGMVASPALALTAGIGILTGVGGAVAVGAVGTVAGPAAALVGFAFAADRLANALGNTPALDAEQNLKRTQRLLLTRLDDLEDKVQNEVAALQVTRSNAIAACQALEKQAQSVKGAAQNVRTQMASLRGLHSKIKAASSICQQAPAIKAYFDALQGRAEGKWEDSAVKGIEWAKGAAASCKTMETASRIEEMYNTCKKLAVGMALKAEQAKSKIAEIEKVRETADQANSILATAELIKGSIDAALGRVQNSAASFNANLESAKSLKAQFDGQRGALLQRIETYRSAFPENPGELDKEGQELFIRFTKIRENANSLQMIRECIPENIDPGQVTESKLDCERIFGEATGLIADARASIAVCSNISDLVTSVASAAQAIQASANYALLTLAGADDLPQKVADCRNRVDAAAEEATKKAEEEPRKKISTGDITKRFRDNERDRSDYRQGREAADAYTSYRTGVTTLPQGPITPSGGTTTTSRVGTPQTAGTTGTGTPSGGTTAIGQTTPGTKPPITTGGTTTPPITPTGGSGPTGMTTAGTSQVPGRSSQPSTISIRADSGHIIQINFPNGEGKSVKQETLQSGGDTVKMNVIACPGVGSHVDAAVNISVSIGSDEVYLIYTTRDIWDPTRRNLVVHRGVNIAGEPINEGDLKRITSEYKVYVWIKCKGQELSTTYFCLQGTK